MAVSYVSKLIPHLKKLVPEDPYGCLNIRDVIINHPKGGVESVIEELMRIQIGRTPKFVPAGHYGIDALDGVLWAFHRLFNLGKTDCLPRMAQDFARDLKIGVVGIKSEAPVFLRNLTDVEEFSKGREFDSFPRRRRFGRAWTDTASRQQILLRKVAAT